MSCARMSELGNTGLIAIDYATRFSSSITMIGFNFYQGRNSNRAYEFGKEGHLNDLSKVGVLLYQKFLDLIVKKNSAIKFTHFVDSKEALSQIAPDSALNYEMREFPAGLV